MITNQSAGSSTPVSKTRLKLATDCFKFCPADLASRDSHCQSDYLDKGLGTDKSFENRVIYTIYILPLRSWDDTLYNPGLIWYFPGLSHSASSGQFSDRRRVRTLTRRLEAGREERGANVVPLFRYGLLNRMVKIPGGAGIVSRLVLDQVSADVKGK